jgi:hypothetical protein
MATEAASIKTSTKVENLFVANRIIKCNSVSS